MPFDIFLLNLKNMHSLTDAHLSHDFKEPESDEASDYSELQKREKKLLSSLNIQVFMEHVCTHKRHIKLENLKSINLSHNKLKRTKLMFDLATPIALAR